jgi:pre-mRNA-processing factor SLU7
MTHKAKDCVERPRAKGAKLTGAGIAADEKIQEVALDYEGKHDRYNGYDAAEYARVIERYDAVEALKTQKHKERQLERTLRREARAARRRAAAAAAADGGAGTAGALGAVSDDSEDDSEDEAAAAAAAAGGDDDDEEKLADADASEFGQVTRRVRTAGGGASSSVRNLRIREDTAKYLLNLDVASAHYDPKTRSMREDPTPHARGERTFAGDNAYRRSGDASAFGELAVHAWEAEAHGQALHVQAAPSAAEALFKQFKAKKDALAGASRAAVLDRYGDAAAADPPPEGLLLGQSEAYAEYDAAGRLLRGAEAAAPRSRYEEDVHPGNHTSVWGSFWSDGAWGFACCRSHQRGSYCTGAAGIAAAAAAGALMAANVAAKEERVAAAAAEAAASGAAAKAPGGRGVGWGSDVAADVALDPAKLAKALAAETARNAAAAAAGQPGAAEERKRGYNSLAGDAAAAEVTEEDMEAWRLKRARADDPLAAPGAGTAGYDLV